MSAKCSKCSVECVNSDTVAKCVECSATFHFNCIKKNSSQNLTKSKLKTWKCENCSSESASVKSNEDPPPDFQSILDALSTMKADINANTDKKVGDLAVSISVLTKKFEYLEGKTKLIEEGQNELRQRCDELERERGELTKEIKHLRSSFFDVEQHSRCANLEIVGVPVTINEDMLSLLQKIATVVDVQFKKEDISIVHRLRLYSKKHRHPPIIVQFVSRQVKEAWLAAARRNKGLKASDVATSLPSSNIYINEQLTRHNKELLGKARRLMKERKLHFAGYFNGKVLVKKTADPAAQSVRVLSLEDLDVYDC